MKRIFLIVLDSFGIGELPDAVRFGDAGSNTLAAIRKHPAFSTPNLRKLGLFHIDGVAPQPDQSPSFTGCIGRMAEASNGKTPPSATGRSPASPPIPLSPPIRTASRRISAGSFPAAPGKPSSATTPTPAPK